MRRIDRRHWAALAALLVGAAAALVAAYSGSASAAPPAQRLDSVNTLRCLTAPNPGNYNLVSVGNCYTNYRTFWAEDYTKVVGGLMYGHLRNSDTQQCLGAGAYGYGNRSAVYAINCDGSGNDGTQLWQSIYVSCSIYTICAIEWKNLATGRCLEAGFFTEPNYPQVDQYDCDARTAERWVNSLPPSPVP
jgi:hypothetical protein